jgi:hypothetical protein
MSQRIFFRRAKQRRETGVRIKSRPAQPINGTIAVDQRGRLAVADARIVFNRQDHQSTIPLGGSLQVTSS